MTDSSNINTFWDLINEHRIDVPIIQRDYAQGRGDNKATQIRESFVRALVNCLKNDNSLHLEFIYGKVEGRQDKIKKNKQAVTDLLKSVSKYSDHLDLEISYNISVKGSINGYTESWFIPLDGQQRLTTLFLLHWYISSRLDIHHSNILSRFSYKIRRSSKAFCKALVSSNFRARPIYSLSKEIRDSSWFYRNWYKDPTVRGMLIVLDEIQNNLNTTSLNELSTMWKRLTVEKNITFKFLDLDRFRLTDELYVKMNARGKHLTDFENFKAWLQEYVRDSNIPVPECDWHKKLDLSWMDLFWKYRATGIYEVDVEYLSFFKQLGIYTYTETFKSASKKNDDFKSVIDEIKAKGYVSESLYQRTDLFDQNCLELIMKTLNAAERGGIQILDDILAPLSDPKADKISTIMFGKPMTDLELNESVYVYSLISFLKKKNKNLADYSQSELSELLSWARVTKNLTANTFIYGDDFLNAIQSVSRLSENAFNIYEYLSGDNPEITFFNMSQRDEEILKAKMILNHRSFEELFISTERHPYFSGQIGFLINISTDESGFNTDSFRQYSRKAGALFSSEILNSQEYLFQRAYLIYKNYFLPSGPNKTFCKNTIGLRDKEDNWRKVFKDKERLDKFRELLDALNGDKIKEGLFKLINRYRTKSWKSYFIKSPEPFKACNEQLVRMDDEKEQILLFKTTRVYGSHAELRTYFFYCNQIKGKVNEFYPFKEESYWYNQGNSDSPCIVFDNYHYRNQRYQLLIYYRHEKRAYEFQFFIVNEELNFSPTISACLIENGFRQTQKNYLCFITQNESELQTKLKQICVTLK